MPEFSLTWDSYAADGSIAFEEVTIVQRNGNRSHRPRSQGSEASFRCSKEGIEDRLDVDNKLKDR